MKKNIFVVDDDEKFIDLALNWEFDESEIHTFLDPFQAVKGLIDIKPDIIITDVMMPYYNGFQFSYIASNILQHKNIVTISANEKEDVLKLSDGVKLKNFYRKPLGRDFFDFVDNMLESLDKLEKPDYKEGERRLKQFSILQDEYEKHQDSVTKHIIKLINNEKQNAWPSSNSINTAIKMLDFKFEELPDLVDKLNKNTIPWEQRILNKINLDENQIDEKPFDVINKDLLETLPKENIKTVSIIKNDDGLFSLSVNGKNYDCLDLEYHKYEFYDCQEKREAMSYVYCMRNFNHYLKASISV